jgi:hypothetical protein
MMRSLASICVIAAALHACHHGGETDSAHSTAAPEVWLRAPVVDPSIAVPNGPGQVLAHALASGTQNYTCTSSPADGGAHFGWSFTGPEATLSGAGGASMGKHFASKAGATAPEWETPDGTFVIGSKVAGFTPAGASDSVPWLLIRVDSHGGAGPLAQAAYIHRVNTHGGVTPKSRCDASHGGSTEKVPYGADYFFYAAQK